ncbi:MAG TPA: acetylglutamate kinase [Flavipsychrobacter sp.]|nr:acetylglutamate kinase [Flavipsychrobacter sp.]
MLTVIKIGGNIIDDANRLLTFLADFSRIDGAKILVHGGGKIATDIGFRLGIQPQYMDGRRITDKETLDLVTMVYGGLINKNIVAGLQELGSNAIGFTGADATIIKAKKRPVSDVDFGFVGDIDSSGINTGVIEAFLEMGLIPVIAPLTHDGEGNLLNTNADTIAQEIAKAMSAVMDVQLIYCFEKNGVLLNPDDEDSVISQIHTGDVDKLVNDRVISDGMIPKINNACEAVRSGVKRVVIGNASAINDILKGNNGTVIQ